MLEQLINEAPNEPILWGNLVAVYEQEGNLSKAESLIKHALEIDPDYLMGRCNLAMLHINRGDDETARQVFDGLSDQAELHVQEAITLYGIDALLYARAGDQEKVRTILDSVEPMAIEADEKQRLDKFRRMVDNVGASVFDKLLRIFNPKNS